MDNLPNDPSNPNTDNPPPFGSNFNPYVNPPDPNNPYQNIPPQNPNPDLAKHSHYSEAAQHKIRDEHGRFIPQPHYPQGSFLPNQAVPTTSYPPNPSLPSIPSDTPKTESNLKKIIKFIAHIKWKVVLGYLAGLIGIISYLFSLPPVKNWAEANFPHNSPLFNREVAHQGILKSSSTGLYTLVLPNGEVYTLHFKPSASLTNLKKLNEVIIKGNLTGTPYVIENAEIFPFNITTDDSDSSPKSPKTPNNSNPSSPPNP